MTVGVFKRPIGAVAAPVALAVGLLAIAGCASLGSAAGGPAPIRVLIYNIHAGHDAAGRPNLRRVAELVRESGADIALLQEVDRGTERSGNVDQLAVLERLTGLHGAFGKTLDYQGGDYGIAILSRWPIARDTLIHLPVEPPQERAGGSHEARGVLRVRVAAPGGPLEVLNTHLDASGTDHYRVQEVETVRAVANRLRESGAPVLVGGDFNAEPGSVAITMMRRAGWRDAWRRCGAGEGGTYPSDDPVKRIDYLFVSPALRCVSARVIETEVSDHRPLLVVVART